MGTNAKAGGEYGINGEWYEGGQFMPSYEDSVKGALKAEAKKQAQAKSYLSRKQLVAPYKWELPTSTEVRSIWDRIENEVYFVGKTGYSKETGKTGTIAIIPWKLEDYMSEWSDELRADFAKLVEMWNAGERWYNVSDFRR